MNIMAISQVMGLPSHRRMERIISAPSVRTILCEKGRSRTDGDQAKAVRTGIELGKERGRRALEREGKCWSRRRTAETEGEPRGDKAQRCYQANEQDGQHRRQDAGI